MVKFGVKCMSASPILISGLELLQHAVEHLRKGSNRDLKLAVLHADNSVELILKEISRYHRIRIIDKKGQSIGYYDCIDELQKKSVSIPELPDIDLLHTERNSIYHLGSQPDSKKTEWLVFGVAINFIKRVCKSELKYDIIGFSQYFDQLALYNKELLTQRKAIVEKYLSEAVLANDNGLHNQCVISSYSGIEAYLGSAIPLDLRSNPSMMQELVNDDLISEITLNNFMKVREIRNRIVHGESESTFEESELALKTFKEILYSVDSVLQ